MKILVVFYSRTNNTKKVAEAIAKEANADLEEVFDTVDRSGAWGYVMAGRDAFMKKPTVIKELTKDPAQYDLVILGTPVWAGTMAPAIRTYITMNKNKIKKCALFCTHGANADQGALQKIEEWIGKKPLAIFSAKTKDVVDNTVSGKIKEFCEIIKDSGI